MSTSPSILLQGQPVQDPLTLYSRAAALKQALGQQQLQQQEIQQGQQQLNGQRALDQAYQQAFTKDTDGNTTLNKDAVVQGLTARGAGHLVPGVLKGFQEMDTAAADLKKKQAEAKTAADDYTANSLLTIADSKYDPSIAVGTIAHARETGAISPQQAVQIASQIAANPTPQTVQSIIEPLLSRSPAYQKLVDSRKTAQAATDTAAARAVTAQTGAVTAAAKLPGEEANSAQAVRADAAARLGAARSPAEYQAILGKLPFEVAKEFDGKTPDQARQLGMTAEQQTTAAQAATNQQNEQRYRDVMTGLERGRLSVAQADLALKQQQFGFDTNGGISPTAQVVAKGDLSPQTVRSIIRRNPGIVDQIKKADPAFDEANIDNRYNTLKEFTNTSVGKAGGQVLALNTLIHHADLYQQTAQALNNGTFRPGNAAYNAIASAFGSAPPTEAALVARFLAGETGKVATGGVPAEGEINGILKSLSNSNSPEQIAQAGKTLLQIAAGRAIPLMERVNQAKIQNVVQVLGPDAKAILQRNGFDPATMKPQAAGTGQTVTKQDVQDYATKNKLSYADAEAHVKANGFVVQ